MQLKHFLSQTQEKQVPSCRHSECDFERWSCCWCHSRPHAPTRRCLSYGYNNWSCLSLWLPDSSGNNQINQIYVLTRSYKTILSKRCYIYFHFKQGKLFDKLKLHDTCGINNLHGMPGVISALASAVMCGIATEAMYGAR